MSKTPAQEVQLKALGVIKDAFADSEQLTRPRREELVRVYKAYSTFIQPKERDWSSSFKVNKAHEVVEKILPRIVAKNPRWIVSVRSPETESEYATAIQDYLTYIWDEYNLTDPARLWAKNMLIYGKGYAKVKYKYEVASVLSEEMDEAEEVVPEEGEALEPQPKKARTTQKVVGEYPTIEVKSWTDVYYDPRYIQMSDRPYWIEVAEGVRLADLLRKPDKYFNLDKLKELSDLSNQEGVDSETYKARIRAITGVSDTEVLKIDKNSLTLRIYYGYFCEGDDVRGEKIYKICTVADLLVISYEEIAQNPLEEIKCFENPELAYATGFVEPIIGLMDEMNFSKNAASEYINKALTRQVIWSPASGIDPRDINNPVISTTADGQTALSNFVELPHREVNSDYFQKDNDLERQIQSMTFTVDTSNPKNEQALTNTATGIRVKFFESNSVIDEVRKHFEQGLARLAYKLLQSTFENLEDNIVIKKQGTEGYWEMNKEVLRDAITRYTIKVETNSSSFDDLESRREDAIALFNLMLQGNDAGVPVDMTEGFKEVLLTFEKKDPNKFIKPPDMLAATAGLPGVPSGASAPMEQPARGGSEAAELTESVAQGGLTQGL